MRHVIAALLIMMFLVAGVAQAQTSVCRFEGTLDDLWLYHAPLTSHIQLKEKLPGGISYPVTALYGEHFLIAVDDDYGGWVDRRSGRLSGDCDAVPVDSVPSGGYPTICWFTASADVPAYYAATLTGQSGSLPSGRRYITLRQTDTALELYVDHAMSAWVNVEAGTVAGMCAGLGEQDAPGLPVTVLAHARLWSQPDAKNGDVLATFAAGSQAEILDGPVRGPIRLDTDDQGDWYQVRQGVIIGWMWVERFVPVAAASGQAVTLANARLWSQPSVREGQKLADLPIDVQVDILAGPVRGPLRADINFDGDWYQVRLPTTGEIGWVWVERLAFS